MKIFICNSEKKIVTQKATMEKPVGYDLFDLTASVMATDRYNQCEIYKQHLASLRSFPAEWVRPDQDGLEVELDKDFRLKYQIDCSGNWIDVIEMLYNRTPHISRRIVTLPQPNDEVSDTTGDAQGTEAGKQ